MELYYTIGQPPLRDKPGGNTPSGRYVPQNKVISLLAKQNVFYNGLDTVWYQIEYNGDIGWIYSGYAEPYSEKYPNEVDLNIATPSRYDAAQYIIYEDRPKYNMCGEICCAYFFNEDILSLLDYWKLQSPSYYERIYKGTLDKGTGVGDLKNLIGLYTELATYDLTKVLTDPVLNRPILSQYSFADICKQYQIIIGVRISTSTGRLQPSGTNHWVVPVSVEPDGINNGIITLYNPFPNRKEVYLWYDFVKSVGSPMGICFKKES